MRFEFRFESLKGISVLVLFVYKLMIGSSENSTENIQENAFEHKKKNPGLSANRPSNNWAKMLCGKISQVLQHR